MIEIADRLIGEYGLDDVSMRDVASAAGQRNNSAVQYHFGSRDGLILQVLRQRMVGINADRLNRLEAADAAGLGQDLSTLVRAFFEPVVDLLRSRPSATHYARFLQRVGPVLAPAIPEAHLRSSADDIVMRMIDVLSHLPRRVAFERIDLAAQMFIGALAVHEDRRDAENTVLNTDFEKVVAHLYDMVEAALGAGVGPVRGPAGAAGAAGDAAGAQGDGALSG